MYPSDILPPSIIRSAIFIVNTDPHTAKGTHWLAVHVQPRSYSGCFFDSYGLPSFNPEILNFLNCVFSVREYNTTQLQGWASTVCGEYYCLFAPYMDRRYTPKEFVALFDAVTADLYISRSFALGFGPLRTTRCGGQACTKTIKGNYPTSAGPFGFLHSFGTH